VTRVELAKQFYRLRTLLALAVMAGIPAIMTIAFELRQPRGTDNDLFALARHSGLNVPLAALSVMINFLLPAVVALYAGSAVAEEASWGSLRYLLLRPVSRTRVLLSKLAVVAMFTLLAVTLITLSGLVEGVVAFGWAPVLTPSGAVIPTGAALARIVAATVYIAWSMSGIAALAFMLSTMTDATTGAVAGAVAIAITSEIIVAIEPLGSIRTVFPTYHWHTWEGLFAANVDTAGLLHGVLLQAPYVAVFVAVAWWWFGRKDILC
jgi:ABC-2 type transport system permease protein